MDADDLAAAIDVGTQFHDLLAQANEENAVLRLQVRRLRSALDRLKRVGARLLRERNRPLIGVERERAPWLAMLEEARAQIESLRIENTRLRARLAGKEPP